MHITTSITFAIATLGVSAEVKGAGTLAAELSDATYFHYTSAAGYEGIVASNAIRANARNQVFLTQDMVSSSQALDVLFAGNPAFIGKGTHLIAVDATGLRLQAGVQLNEVIHMGTLRLEGRVLFQDPNPF